MENGGSRRAVLRNFGASTEVVDELLQYTQNEFQPPTSFDEEIVDEEHVETWRGYAREAETIGICESLRRHLVQLSFPIRKGISNMPAYVASVRCGEPPPECSENALGDQVDLRLEIYPSAAGNIPLLITSSRTTFVSLVQALTRRNEPEEIPEAMGACMVAGYNNWTRIRVYRKKWENVNAGRLWADHLPHFLQHKSLYQDRFIILSDGPYSGIQAHDMHLPADIWNAVSLIIRREHECTHYFTKRLLGSMRNNVFDELIADYMGIVEVCGWFRSDWFLRFMGLENWPVYRDGGRFEHYVSGVSPAGISVLMRLLVEAAINLETDSLSPCPRFNYAAGKRQAICALAATTLDGLATLQQA